MSVEKVRAYLEPFGVSDRIREFDVSSATVELAAVAVGVAGLFMEVHPDPDKAPCDGPNMLELHDLPPLLEQLKAFDRLAKETTGIGA